MALLAVCLFLSSNVCYNYNSTRKRLDAHRHDTFRQWLYNRAFKFVRWQHSAMWHGHELSCVCTAVKKCLKARTHRWVAVAAGVVPVETGLLVRRTWAAIFRCRWDPPFQTHRPPPRRELSARPSPPQSASSPPPSSSAPFVSSRLYQHHARDKLDEKLSSLRDTARLRKVAQSHSKRHPWVGFKSLLVSSCIYGPILYNFRDKARYGTITAIFHTPGFGAPLGESPSEYCNNVWYVILEWCGYPTFKTVLWLCLAISTRYRRVTDRQTDILRQHRRPLHSIARYKAIWPKWVENDASARPRNLSSCSYDPELWPPDPMLIVCILATWTTSAGCIKIGSFVSKVLCSQVL